MSAEQIKKEKARYKKRSELKTRMALIFSVASILINLATYIILFFVKQEVL